MEEEPYVTSKVLDFNVIHIIILSIAQCKTILRDKEKFMYLLDFQTVSKIFRNNILTLARLKKANYQASSLNCNIFLIEVTSYRLCQSFISNTKQTFDHSL